MKEKTPRQSGEKKSDPWHALGSADELPALRGVGASSTNCSDREMLAKAVGENIAGNASQAQDRRKGSQGAKSMKDEDG